MKKSLNNITSFIARADLEIRQNAGIIMECNYMILLNKKCDQFSFVYTLFKKFNLNNFEINIISICKSFHSPKKMLNVKCENYLLPNMFIFRNVPLLLMQTGNVKPFTLTGSGKTDRIAL